MDLTQIAENNELRQLDRDYVWHTWTPLSADRSEIMLSHGSGYRVWDIYGKEYLDACSLNLTCGYNHTTLIDAATNQLKTLPGADISMVSHKLVGLLAAKIAKYMPALLKKTLFVNSGSEGVEAAMFIAASYWHNLGEKRSSVIAFSNAYHGSTLTSRVLGGSNARVSNPFRTPFDVILVDLPVPPKELKEPTSLNKLLQAFEQALSQQKNPSPIAIIIEPFLNVGGGIVLPIGFLYGLRQLCDKYNTLLILDEVFTGYARSGKMFAFDHENIVPDIVISSKGLASGYLPIAAVTIQQHIYYSFRNESVMGGLRYGHTTSGHAVSCAVALATMEVIENDGLCQNAIKHGSYLLQCFQDYAGVGNIVDVRSFGLLLALELTDIEYATQLKICAANKGLLLRQCGSTIMAVPPLTIDRSGINLLVEILHEALSMQGYRPKHNHENLLEKNYG